jgi:hypothetical protein
MSRIVLAPTYTHQETAADTAGCRASVPGAAAAAATSTDDAGKPQKR